MQICMLPEIFYSGISGSYSPFLKLCRILSKGSVRKKPQGNRGCVNLFLLLWMEVSMHKHKYYSIFLYKMTNIHMSGWNNKNKTKLAVFSLSSMRTLVINWKDYESDREKHWLKFNGVFSWLIPVNKSRLQKALELATSPFKINSSQVLYIGTKISFPFSLIVCV